MDKLIGLDAIVGPNGVLGISKATWHRGVRAKRFPAPVKLGGRSLWRVSEINALIAKKEGEHAA